MRKLLRGVFFFGLLTFLLGCEKPQLKDLTNYTPRLVVISNFTTQDGIRVQVSKSRSPLDNGPTEYLTNARVEIWEDDKLLERLIISDTRDAKAP